VAFRSLLFVPGARPDRFARALASRADAVCIDLEDAVPASGKDAARESVSGFLAQGRGPDVALGIRINALDTPWSRGDVAAVSAGRPDFVMLPKAADAAQVAELHAELSLPIWPLVETADGLLNAHKVASAVGVAGLLFGAFDYAADVGCELSWEPLLVARSLLVASAARARVQLLDSPDGDVAGLAALEESTHRARRLGFTGRACIHPAQVAVVNAAFAPTAEEIAQARRVTAAFDAAGGGVALLDGRLIERPVVLAARQTLERGGV
jgi:citrate lyase beta subunit